MPDARDFAIEVVSRLRLAGFEALWAGGCVRDLMLGNTPKDFDVATSATPEQVRKLFRRTVAVGQAFGVIRVLGGSGLEVEVATFRIDAEYSDGRRPDGVMFSTAEEDARRRDLTINGLFFDPIEERTIDYVGGMTDMHARLIRAIGDPRARFTEDKLRLLRAIRFAARLDFAIDPATADAIRELAPQLRVVSAERILMEVRLMLESTKRVKALTLLAEHHLAAVVFQELFTDANSPDHWTIGLQTVASLPDTELPLPVVMAALHIGLPDKSPAHLRFFERLKAPNEDRERIVWLTRHRDDFNEAKSKPLHFLKRLFSHRDIEYLLTLHRANALVENACGNSASLESNAWTQRLFDGMTVDDYDPPPLLTGDDLIAAGHQPGRNFGVVLEAIRNAQLDGELTTEAAALDRATAMLTGSIES